MIMKKSCASGLPRITLLKQPFESRVETSRYLCRCLNVPYERGSYHSARATERHGEALVKSQPQPSSPSARAPLDSAPSDLSSDAPARAASAGTRETSACRPRDSGVKITVPAELQKDLRERPDPGSTGLLQYEDPKRDASKSMDKALRYKSEAQRGYEDIDSKFSHHLKPSLRPLEKMADPVSQRFTLKRYHSKPELWQTIGSQWNRRQIRASYYVKKPISFTSPFPKSGQIPLYSGVIGSEDMDNVDIPEKDFIPLTVLRTVLPPHTPTTHRPTIPGYTGKALHDSPHTLATRQLSSVLTPQTTGSSSTPSSYGRQAPLSRMVVTVPPCNPFLQPKA